MNIVYILSKIVLKVVKQSYQANINVKDLHLIMWAYYDCKKNQRNARILKVIWSHWNLLRERERQREKERERESNLYKIQTGRICRWARWVGQTYP